MSCKAIVLILAFIFAWDNVVASHAWAKTPAKAQHFRREGPPPKMETPRVEAPKPEPPKEDSSKIDSPKTKSPAAVRTAKSRVLVCPYLPVKEGADASRQTRGTFCLSQEKAGELASDTLVLVARVEEGTNRLLRYALVYQADMEDLDFWNDEQVDLDIRKKFRHRPGELR